VAREEGGELVVGRYVPKVNRFQKGANGELKNKLQW